MNSEHSECLKIFKLHSRDPLIYKDSKGSLSSFTQRDLSLSSFRGLIICFLISLPPLMISASYLWHIFLYKLCPSTLFLFPPFQPRDQAWLCILPTSPLCAHSHLVCSFLTGGIFFQSLNIALSVFSS